MNFKNFDYDKINEMKYDDFINNFSLDDLADMDISKVQNSKLGNEVAKQVEGELEQVGKADETEKILNKEKGRFDILLKKPISRYFNRNSALCLLPKTSLEPYKNVPIVKTTARFNGNMHLNPHNERIYLLEQAMLYITGTQHSKQLTKFRFASISEPAELLLKIGQNGNLFVNQCNSFMTDDYKRFENLVKELPSLFFKSKLMGQKFTFNDIKNLICPCEQKDELCKHIACFNPEYILMPHSIYYLSEKLIADILSRGIIIIFVCHLFEPGVDSGTIESPLGTTVEWQRKEKNIIFDVKDDKVYEHPEILSFLYYRNNLDFDSYNIRIWRRIKYEGCQHVVGFITPKPNVKVFTYYQNLPINMVVNQSKKQVVNKYILTNKKSINNIIQNYRKDSIYIVNVNDENEERDDKILIKMMDSKIQFTPFRSRHTSLVDFVNFWTKDENELEAPLVDSMVQRMEMASYSGSVQMDLGLYNNLVSICLQLREINEENLKILCSRILQSVGSKISNMAVLPIILDNLISDTLLLNVSVNSILVSDKVKLYNSIVYKKDFNLLDKFYDCLFGTKKLDRKFKNIEESHFNNKRKEHLMGVDVKKIDHNTLEVKDLSATRTTEIGFIQNRLDSLHTNALKLDNGRLHGVGIYEHIPMEIPDYVISSEKAFIDVMPRLHLPSIEKNNSKVVLPINVISEEYIEKQPNPNFGFFKVEKNKKGKLVSKPEPKFIEVKKFKKEKEEDWDYDPELAFLNLFVGNKKISEDNNTGDLSVLSTLPNLTLNKQIREQIEGLQFLNALNRDNYCGLISIMPALIEYGFKPKIQNSLDGLRNLVAEMRTWLQVNLPYVYNLLKNSLWNDSRFQMPKMKDIVQSLNYLKFDVLVTRISKDKLSTFEFACSNSIGTILLLLYNGHVEWYTGLNDYIPELAFNTPILSNTMII